MARSQKLFKLKLMVPFERVGSIESEILAHIDKHLKGTWTNSHKDGAKVYMVRWKGKPFQEFTPEKRLRTGQERKAFEKRAYRMAVDEVISKLVVLLDFTS